MKVIKCCVCGKAKNEEEYALFHGKRNRSCKQCRRYHNEFYKTNKDGYRDKRKSYYLTHRKQHQARAFRNHLKRKYGITLDEYRKMLVTQDNRCLICQRDFSTLTKWNRACVDHNHANGKVRGLLCRKCNLMLAYIEDLRLWPRATSYLQVKEVKDKELSR